MGQTHGISSKTIWYYNHTILHNVHTEKTWTLVSFCSFFFVFYTCTRDVCLLDTLSSSAVCEPGPVTHGCLSTCKVWHQFGKPTVFGQTVLMVSRVWGWKPEQTHYPSEPYPWLWFSWVIEEVLVGARWFSFRVATEPTGLSESRAVHITASNSSHCMK